MKRFCLRLILLCGLLGLTPGAARSVGDTPAATPKLHSHMVRLLEERGPCKGWVFFKDKGIHSRRELREALRRARLDLHPRALARRQARRTAPGMVDYRDLPVYHEYTEKVMAAGGKLFVESRWLNAISVEGSLDQFQFIASLPFVDRIEPVRRGTLMDTVETQIDSLEIPNPERSTPAFYGIMGPQLEELNLIALHNRGFTGTGVVIGMLDTGFYLDHEAFNEPGHSINVVAEYDFLNDDGYTGIEPEDPSAQHNHGTMVIGTIAAYLPNELVGGAFDASFILCKVEDTTDEYEQEEDYYVAGVEFLEANGADLASSSLGYDDWYEQSELDGLTATTTIAVNAAISNGLHFCTAAGNNHHDSDPMTSSLIAPGDAFVAITCGAVHPNGEIVDFSSDGPTGDGRVKPEVLARGYDVMTVCAHVGGEVDCTTDTRGTSVSTPLIACAVACLVQAHPTWTPAQLRNRLIESSSGYLANGTFDPLYVRGYGIPDANLAASSFPTAIRLAPTYFPY